MQTVLLILLSFAIRTMSNPMARFSNNCRNCKHFIIPMYKNTVTGLYEGKCMKFIKPNISDDNGDGEYEYMYSMDARRDETMCGRSGRLYEKGRNPNVFIDFTAYTEEPDIKNKLWAKNKPTRL